MSERLWFLKRCDLFQRLRPEQLHEVELRSRSREFPRNTPVYLPADQADGVMLLVRGRVKIGSFTEEGKQTILAFIEPGELFGELSLIGAVEREEYAETVEKSTIVMIPREIIQELIRQNPEVSLGVTKLFGLRRQRVERRLKYLLFHSNRERLVHLMLELAETYGRRTPDGVELKIKLSHQDLASVIGSTRETVTVVLGELQSEGKLKLGRRKIILTELAKMAESVHQPAPAIASA
ncbi:Crp/Fnr family transcriptional regulator [Adhaeretor mobilis]|uniref:Global nitrogen regulator n=1 Tax=Adhaeretor mobilis TaxID=1930276 RepID=A0A517MU60_9BACT|nr:Crp/Fnr family transcriptional regulator [Adhaeretor mobilis]QDS98402.1 Global nitrogen regulator [Adhaeretor mobilis]